jgi:DNA-3-methyladenine glycosylase II
MDKLSPVQYLTQKDCKLSEIIKSIGEYSKKTHNDPFESLIKSIISQQLSGKAANAIFNRFKTYYNNTNPTPNLIISTPNETFRTQIGLSLQKIGFIKDLSTRISDERLNLRFLSELPDEKIIDELVKVKGIGRWTAEMFLIFCLGREDVMPVRDLGIRKAMKKLYDLPQLPEPSYILEISEPWRPYRSIASWYLWKSLANFDTVDQQKIK